MKLLTGFILFCSISNAFACTDFSGRYLDQENNQYSVAQSGCESLSIINDEGSFTAIADGQFRVSSESDEARVLTAITFSGSDLVMDNHLEFKFSLPPEVPVEVIPVRLLSIYRKVGNGDVAVTTSAYNLNGQFLGIESTTHQKL